MRARVSLIECSARAWISLATALAPGLALPRVEVLALRVRDPLLQPPLLEPRVLVLRLCLEDLLHLQRGLVVL